MPRAFSSGAASIWSYDLYSPKYLVIAAVSDVLPWSTCPIVPTFTCGFVRSNFAFAILAFPSSGSRPRAPSANGREIVANGWRRKPSCAFAASAGRRAAIAATRHRALHMPYIYCRRLPLRGE